MDRKYMFLLGINLEINVRIVENIHLKHKKHTSGHKRLLKCKIDGASADSSRSWNETIFVSKKTANDTLPA